ncbi:MAG: hypothetical protein ACI3YD_01910 [Alloprevotella sp.]
MKSPLPLHPLRRLSLLVLLLASLQAAAQTDGEAMKREFGDAFMQADSLAADSLTRQTSPTSSLPRLPLSPYAAPMLPTSPWGYAWLPDAWGLSPWPLHEGMNAQFGMSLSVGLGKHAPKGVGFGQSAALAYVLPLNNRWSLAAGVYARNMDWGGWHTTDGGVTGIIGYQLSEVVSLYAYGSKSFLPTDRSFRFRHALAPTYLFEPKERLGAAAEFKLGEKAVIGVSVEHNKY